MYAKLENLLVKFSETTTMLDACALIYLCMYEIKDFYMKTYSHGEDYLSIRHIFVDCPHDEESETYWDELEALEN